MVSDKKIHRLLELIQLYKQNPLDNFFFIFTIYQNYTLDLKLGRELFHQYLILSSIWYRRLVVSALQMHNLLTS